MSLDKGKIPEDVLKLLEESEIQYKQESKLKEGIPDKVKKFRYGVLIFAFIQLVFEITISLIIYEFMFAGIVGIRTFENANLYANSLDMLTKSSFMAVLVVYMVSMYYGKSRINKNKVDSNYLKYGLKVSSVVFGIKLFVSILITYFILLSI